MFGKPPQGMSGMPTYGAPTMSQQFVGAGRGRAQYDRKEFHWKGTYKLPVSPAQPDIGRLIAGSYQQQWLDDYGNLQEGTLPFIMYGEHYNGHQSCVCSAGPFYAVKDKALPCPSCVIFWEDVAVRKMKKANGDKTPGPERISRRNFFAFNWYDYGMYYQVPQMQKNGQPYINRATGQAYVDWVKGVPNDQRFAPYGYPFKWGHLMPWCVPSTYKEELDTYTKMVSSGCVSCGSRDSIITITRNCGNPQCRAVIYDANSVLTPEQKALIDYTPFQCGTCGQKMFTTEEVQCRNCQNPKRASIFDVDLQVQRSAAGKGTPHLKVLNYSEPRPIQVPPEVAATIQPLDLISKFASTPPDEQKRIMGLAQLQQNLAQPGLMGMQGMVPQQYPYGAGAQPPYGVPVMGQPPVQPPPGMAWQPPQQPPMAYGQPAGYPMQQPQPMPMAPQPWQQPQQPMMQAPYMQQGAAPAFPTMGAPPMAAPQGPAVPYDEDDAEEPNRDE